MISIIICSREPDISPTLKENIQCTIGIEYEFVIIDNSSNSYSIFTAYNEGVRRSRFPFLCFVHEDIYFHTKNWGKNLITHLTDENTGIIGVAGGIMMTKTPAPSWAVGEKNIHIIQHRRKKIYNRKNPQDFSNSRRSAILLDGVFLSARRELFDKIQFDESFLGFHGYDFDICVQSTVAGYTNYVVYDILLEHFSGGNGNARYFSNLISIYKKWENHLPLYSADIQENTVSYVNKIQLQNIEKLIHRMISTGFPTKEIIDNIKYFVNVFGSEEAKKILRHIRIKIFFVRLTRSPQYLFYKAKL